MFLLLSNTFDQCELKGFDQAPSINADCVIYNYPLKKETPTVNDVLIHIT